jgi:hypothetical protein
MLLVLNGLPRPELQVSIRDEEGIPIGCADLYYREQRLGIEYDGETHRASSRTIAARIGFSRPESGCSASQPLT